MLIGTALGLAGCGTAPDASRLPPAAVRMAPLLPAFAEIVHPSPPPPAPPGCTDPTASSAPPATMPAPGDMPAGSWMSHILARGYLIVGTGQSTYDWGYRDPVTGQLSGFDIDMLRQVSQAIFGSPDRIRFVVVNNDQRVQAVRSGQVDILAETMTINCAREKYVDFSTVYFEAGQEILVPTDSTISGPSDLNGKRVCATFGSTSLQNLVKVAPRAILWAVQNETDCLVMLQQGQVDAISTDNAILQGLAAQDPNTKIVGPPFTSEPYGMAISKAHPEFTSFVNGVLAQERADGTWAAIYEKWLGPNPPAPPVATYTEAP
ncbi:MAG: glutamate ABC transporter substrate-binding protein [Acidimicrobiales bacterium]